MTLVPRMNKTDTRIVELWLAPEPATLTEAQSAAWAVLLSQDEHTRWQRFARAEDRQRFLLARALTRTVLANRLGVEPGSLVFTQNQFGKPLLTTKRGESLHFNLSHTQGLAVLAVCSSGEVGVDVERYSRKVELLALARRYFATLEVQALEALDGEARREHFFALWTLKEAWVKAKGLGLRVPLDSFGFELSQEQGGAQITLHCADQLQETPGQWSFMRYVVGEHRIALAAVAPDARTRHAVPLQVELKRWAP
jgi:4'-phosphopantetheinyl transferase